MEHFIILEKPLSPLPKIARTGFSKSDGEHAVPATKELVRRFSLGESKPDDWTLVGGIATTTTEFDRPKAVIQSLLGSGYEPKDVLLALREHLRASRNKALRKLSAGKSSSSESVALDEALEVLQNATGAINDALSRIQ